MQPVKIRTLIVDDSVFYRGILSNILKKMHQVDYLGSASNGKHALTKIEQLRPDLVTLDVEMPDMNGIEVLQQIKQRFPDIQVVMISAATRESAFHTIEALQKGALDFISKPSEGSAEENDRLLHRQMRRILSVVETKIILKQGKIEDISTGMDLSERKRDIPATSNRIEIVVIGISTGGPQSLPAILSKLPATFKAPVVIVQHMPPMFVSVLASTLNRTTELNVVEATDNQVLETGYVYLAPGDFHTCITSSVSTPPTIKLSKDPPENFFRPSVNYLFRSVAETYGNKALAVIMTGMGRDGVDGMKLLKSYGATTIAQDKQSSVVFGMPMEAIKANVVDSVASLDDIAEILIKATSNTSFSQTDISRQ